MKQQRGFTLVELMVSLALLGILTALSVRLAHTVMEALRAQREAVAAERSARMSLDMVADAVRNSAAGVPTADVRDSAGCSSTVALAVTNSGTAPDELRLITASGGTITSLRTPITMASNSFQILDATGLAAGDVVLITNGTAGRLMKVLSIAPAGTEFLVTTAPASACSVVPFPSAGFAIGSLVIRARATRYFVGALPDGTPALMMDPDDAGALPAEPLAEGIEDMQIAIGADTNNDGTLFEAPSTSDEWFYNVPSDPTPPVPTTTRWRAIRITLIARTLKETGNDPASSRPASEDRSGGAMDKFRRRVLSTVVDVRNFEGSP